MMTEEEMLEAARQMGKASREWVERLWRELGGTGPVPRGDVRIYVGGPCGAVRVWPEGEKPK